MVKYDKSKKHAYFNNINFTRDESTGYYLSSIKVKDDKRQRLHVYVWEYYNSEVPKGYEVHHKDEDKYNNDISNLELLEDVEHRKVHAISLKNNKKRLERLRKHLNEVARPKASEWHKSKEGRRWHVKQGKETWVNKEPIKYLCSNCGKEFESLNSYSEESNRFCSNNCKSAWRRKKGYDNETRVCVICKNNFIANKYSKSQTCSRKCRGELRSLNSIKLKG